MNQIKSSFKDHEVQKLRLCNRQVSLVDFVDRVPTSGPADVEGSSERSVSLPGAAQVLDGAKPSSPTGPPTDLLRDFLSCTLCPSNFSKWKCVWEVAVTPSNWRLTTSLANQVKFDFFFDSKHHQFVAPDFFTLWSLLYFGWRRLTRLNRNIPQQTPVLQVAPPSWQGLWWWGSHAG